MMTENSQNMQPRDIVVLYNKLVCMTDNKIVYIFSRLTVIKNLRLQNSSTSSGSRKGKPIPLQAWTGPEGSRKLSPQIPRQSAHEGCKAVSPMHRPPLHPRKYSWYSLLLEDESTPGPQCSREDYVNGKFEQYHRESNPRPSSMKHDASTNCTPHAPSISSSSSSSCHQEHRAFVKDLNLSLLPTNLLTSLHVLPHFLSSSNTVLFEFCFGPPQTVLVVQSLACWPLAPKFAGSNPAEAVGFLQA